MVLYIVLKRIFKRWYFPILVGVVGVFGIFGAPKFVYASVMIFVSVLYGLDISFWLFDLFLGALLSAIASLAFLLIAKSKDSNIAKTIPWPEIEG